jgi:hypothetical protein
MKTLYFNPNIARDFTYSEGCGCRVTFFAEAEYATSRMDPGNSCTLHTRPHQYTARDSFVSAGRAALAEYRHETQTVRQYLQQKRHGDVDLFSVIDGEHSSGFMPLRQALVQAAIRFGRVTLNVWDCDARDWTSELVADADY